MFLLSEADRIQSVVVTDMQNDTCTDRGCFETKMLAHIQKQMDSRPGLLKFSDYTANHKKDASVVTGATCRRLWGKEDKCKAAEEAIFIDGSERGKTTLVCRDKECSKHGVHSSRATGGDNSDAVNRKKHRAEKMFRQRLFSEICQTVNSVPEDKVTRIVAHAMWRRVAGDSKRALLKAAGHDAPRESVERLGDRLIQKATPVKLGRIMVCMSIAEELMVPTYQPSKAETMLKLADIYGVDVKAVRDGLKDESKAKSAAKPSRKHKKARAVA